LSIAGGGGGGGFIGAAIVSINLSPSVIDTGDRTQIETWISEVHENGIILKFRYPAGLTYVRDTAILEANEQQLDIGPAKNVASGNYRYLVFFFTREQFGEDNYGKLTFQLEGKAVVADGKVEVDADVDDPLIDNSVEFDPRNPEFVAEDEAGIKVRG